MATELQKLEARATYKGHATIEKRDFWKGSTYRVPFHEIMHYFDANHRELGFEVSFSGNVHLFNPPRIWAKEFLDNCDLWTIIH